MTDMHTHSNKSDGEHSPADVVKMAFERGVKTLSLTDHDTVVGNDEAYEKCKELGMNFITGIEISANEHRSLHILGYGIDTKNKYLIEMCEKFAESRRNRTSALIGLFAEHNMFITEEDVLKFSDGGTIARPHFARALVEKGYVSTVKQAFDEYLETPEFRKIKRYKASANEAIQIIHKAGGLAVMAHPYQLKKSDSELEELIESLVDSGLDGIECYYSRHTPQMMIYYRQLIERFDLLTSIGSDFHGYAVKPDIELGTGHQNSLVELQKVCAFKGNRDILDCLSKRNNA